MPRNHMLAYGGDRGNDGRYRDLLPQGGAPHKDFPMEIDIRKSGCARASIMFALNPDRKECNTSPLQVGVAAQGTYFMECPVQVGDVINAVIIPKWSTLHGVWWALRNPVPGLTVNIGLQACAQSLNPDGEERPLDAIGLPIIEGLDLGQSVPLEGTECGLPSDYVCVQSPGNKPGRYVNQNDMLSIEIVTLPEEEDFKCIDFLVSPVVDTYCTGDMAAMSKWDEMSMWPNRPTRRV